MTTPFESAQLILKLFELRRDPLLREARNWFVRQFHPDSAAEIRGLSMDQNRMFRMVTGYWDMACSLVNHGAIDRQMFLDANGEVFGTFCKVEPHLAELRQLIGQPHFLKHAEQVVMSVPGVEARLEALRQMFRTLSAQRGEAKT